MTVSSIRAPRAVISPDIIARLTQIVGANNAITDPAEQEGYLVEERGLYHGHTPLVLRPGSVAEVAAILRLANETKTPIVPQGGNTGLVGGQVPHGGEVLLSLKRLDRIREVDATSNAMTCEAGVVLAKAQAAAADVDRLFPLSLGAEGSCTIGGNLSTNAGGTSALAYGVARDLVLGLEVVLADGQIWHGLNKLKKDNTGYDLKHLFMGAEGTLGVITAAVLKLFPRPRAVETAFIGLPSPRAAIALLNLVQERTGGRRHQLRAHQVARSRACVAPWARRARSAAEQTSVVRAAPTLLAKRRPARRHGGRARRRGRARADRRCNDRREPRSGKSVLAHPRDSPRGAEARGRIGQARHIGADRVGSAISGASGCGRSRS